MKYVLEHFDEAARLERQSQAANYDIRSELADFGLTKARSFLDAGCGSGIAAREVVSKHPEVRVVAIDISEARVSEARRLAGTHTSIDFKVADMTRTLNTRFDRIFCRFVVEHLSNERQSTLVKNLTDSLNPGGLLRLVDIDGILLNIYPRTSLMESCLELFEKKRAIDFFVGRKLPKLLIDAGLEEVIWSIHTITMNNPELLAEECSLITERFRHTLPTMAQLLGSETKALAFQREYLSILKSPGATLFYNKFVATGRKRREKKGLPLKAV